MWGGGTYIILESDMILMALTDDENFLYTVR